MITIYKCQYTGKEFDCAEDCEVHEYVAGGEQQKFYDLANIFIEKLQEEFPNITVLQTTIKMLDEKEFLYCDRIEQQRYLTFDFTIDGKTMEYRRYSDEVGDYRWDWKIKDNIEDLILDFKKEFIYPNMKEFEGEISYNYNSRNGFYSFNEVTLDYLANLFEGKKIKIEILD